ncbi:DUF2721 domain-containing protein [Aureimonas leprariae]|uniref:DUF2721 domain-containing protein n=1 Tax=Plantimonas leprariae TaxID=2615207 RepID=A0A7V7PNY5_9HYPH|nr:DUF2721 domain-containing protein [Aureimonas leprariae]KAB0679564.1 DUF2721 domain-containing protein [Aureimonas leprariae]
MPVEPLDSAAHVIQLALTPVFLLTAVASLMNVFATRLARVLDRIHQMTLVGGQRPVELARLRLRSKILDAAVVLAALAACMTCCAAAILFFGELGAITIGTLLFGFFGGALLATIFALVCFSTEIVISGRAVREAIDTGTPSGDGAGT